MKEYPTDPPARIPHEDPRARLERRIALFTRHPALCRIAETSPIAAAHIDHGFAYGWPDETILAVTLVAMAEHASALMRMHERIAAQMPPRIIGPAR